MFPSGRTSRAVGPGVELRDSDTAVEDRRRERELDDMTAME